jgi:hypothetical protein
MSRYSSGMTAGGAGTTLRPVFALKATASVSGVLRQVEVVNTTDTACEYRLVNLTAGTPGATQTARRHRRNAPAAICVPVALYTADATIGEDTGYRFRLGAANGSAWIATFGDNGLEVELGATSALGLVPVGTGQIVAVNFVWDE